MDLEKLKELLKKHGLNDDDIDDIVRESSKPAEGEGEGEEPTPNPEEEAKNEGEPEGNPAPEGEGDGGNPEEGNPEPNEPTDPEPESEPNPEAEPTPEGEGQPVPPEGEGEPNPQVEPEAAPNPEPQPEPVKEVVTREEYEELKKANEGLGARLDALEKSLAESGVIREAPQVQVGFKTPDAHDDRHEDEDWNDILDEMNG